jgi:class 3 adenylate cyclase
MITVTMTDGLGAPDGLVAALFFLGWAIYLGGGIVVSTIFGPSAAGKRQQEAPLSRATLVDMLFALQRELEDQKQRRAFLSVDVAGSTEMKRGASDLAVEYSFGRLRQHVEELVRARGGTMQSAAGDGMMCVFEDDADAVGAARELQKGMDAFNSLHNRLSAPFRVRCGVSAGDVAFDPDLPVGFIHSPVVDRAARLQKEARAGGVLVGQEVAAGALRELGTVEPVEPLPGEPGAFAWSPLTLPAPPVERALPAELRQDRF